MPSRRLASPAEQAPTSIDLSRPSPARIYDYVLGGAHNFAVDRAVAHLMAERMPNLAESMRANRRFLRRAVRFLVDAGIRQFLDLGSGIPTVGNVHEIAQGAAPWSRVVYVDADPVAVEHSRVILRGVDRTAILQADVRDPEHILAEAATQGGIDFDQPVAVIAAAVLHFVPDDDDPDAIVARLCGPLASGSYLALSHVTCDGVDHVPEPGVHPRPRTAIEAFFDGLTLVDPGVVVVPDWRPEPLGEPGDPALVAVYGGVGRKD